MCGTCSTFMRNYPSIKSIEMSPRLSASSLRWRDESCIRECMQRVHAEVLVDRISEVCKQPAPSLSDTLTNCAQPPALSHHRFSVVKSRSRRPPAPRRLLMCASTRCDREPQGRQTACPAAPSLSDTFANGTATGTIAPPFLDGRNRPRRSRANMCASIGVSATLTSANGLPCRASARRHSRSLYAATGAGRCWHRAHGMSAARCRRRRRWTHRSSESGPTAADVLLT